MACAGLEWDLASYSSPPNYKLGARRRNIAVVSLSLSHRSWGSCRLKRCVCSYMLVGCKLESRKIFRDMQQRSLSPVQTWCCQLCVCWGGSVCNRRTVQKSWHLWMTALSSHVPPSSLLQCYLASNLHHRKVAFGLVLTQSNVLVPPCEFIFDFFHKLTNKKSMSPQVSWNKSHGIICHGGQCRPLVNSPNLESIVLRCKTCLRGHWLIGCFLPLQPETREHDSWQQTSRNCSIQSDTLYLRPSLGYQSYV